MFLPRLGQVRQGRRDPERRQELCFRGKRLAPTPARRRHETSRGGRNRGVYQGQAVEARGRVACATCEHENELLSFFGLSRLLRRVV